MRILYVLQHSDTQQRSGPTSLCTIVTKFKNFRKANSSNVKQFDTRLNLLFGLASIQFLVGPDRSRELGRVNETALWDVKRYFFTKIARSFFDLYNLVYVSVSLTLCGRVSCYR